MQLVWLMKPKQIAYFPLHHGTNLKLMCFDYDVIDLALHAHGNAHSATNAKSGQSFLGIASFHFMQ